MTDTAPTPPRPRRWRAEIANILGLVLLVLGLHSLVAKPFYIPSESMMPGLLIGDRLIVAKYPYGWSYTAPSFHLLPFIPGRLFGRLPARGDVVILTPPDPARRGEDLIKRAIGLPGDVVQMIGGRLWLNGRRVVTRDMGDRLMPVDGNFRCGADDRPGAEPFPLYARVTGPDGRLYCRLHVIRETLPGGASYDTLDFGPSSEDDTPPYRVPPGHVFVLGDNRDNSADSRIPLVFSGLGGAIPYENIGGRAEFVTFSMNGNAGWNPLSWPAAFRTDRFGASLRPASTAR